jgi:hypothetical protein
MHLVADLSILTGNGAEKSMLRASIPVRISFDVGSYVGMVPTDPLGGDIF